MHVGTLLQISSGAVIEERRSNYKEFVLRVLFQEEERHRLRRHDHVNDSADAFHDLSYALSPPRVLCHEVN